jgi:simple sugar transport system ATP-binding protein
MDTDQATERSLAKEMVGREVIFRTERAKVEKGKPILQVEDLSALSDKDLLALKGVSFSISEGEIFGVAGIAGNGQQELVEVLAGLRNPHGGKVVFDEQDITFASSLHRWELGIGYIPSDRIHVGSIADFSLVENTTMNYYFDEGFYQRGALDYKKLRDLTEEIIAEYSILTPGPDTTAKTLSGGNLQKLILARVLSRKPRLVIAHLPTQGLDVGATEFVRNKLIEAKKDGAGILLISEDLDEVLSISDWVAPIYEGKFMDIVQGETARRDSVGAMCAGVLLEGDET